MITLPNGRKIGYGEPCFVIAEIGQNHQGDAYTATRLLKAAHDAQVDAVKFCKRYIPSELTAAAYNAPYEGPQSFGKTYGQHREALELSPDEYRHLKDRMRYNEWPEVMFATACDRQSVDDLEASINPPLYKVASRDLDNLPLLDYIARLGKPVILSAGMAKPGEIQRALATVRKHHDQIVLMVCTSEYPTPNEHVGLRRIWLWKRMYQVPVGLSDHTPGITAGIAAAALGACCVEKHLTLSRAMKGTDHAASLEPEGVRRMVEKIREVEAMMHLREDVDTSSARAKLGRSWVTARRIEAGEPITADALTLKSPGTGIACADIGLLLGKTARRTLPENATIQLSDVMEAVHVPA